MKKILIINGALGGDTGNSNVVIAEVKNVLSKNHQVEMNEIFLNQNNYQNDLKYNLEWADGFIFTSGTYWDSWGSPMQAFLENCTEFEGGTALFKKPASVIITMHSVGGKEVLSRLQGVLNTMGLMIPPMSGMVYALSTHLALMNQTSFAFDFWSMDDIEIIVHNLLTAINQKNDYQTWNVDKKDPKRRWL